MTARKSHCAGDTERQHTWSAASRFWQDRDRYHDLAENFAQDIAVAHPDGMSGRHPGCPGDISEVNFPDFGIQVAPIGLLPSPIHLFRFAFPCAYLSL